MCLIGLLMPGERELLARLRAVIRGPGEMREAGPPAQCRSCKARLDGAAAAGSRWAQVIDVEVSGKVTEWLLPGLQCPCCGTVTFAKPPPARTRARCPTGRC